LSTPNFARCPNFPSFKNRFAGLRLESPSISNIAILYPLAKIEGWQANFPPIFLAKETLEKVRHQE